MIEGISRQVEVHVTAFLVCTSVPHVGDALKAVYPHALQHLPPAEKWVSYAMALFRILGRLEVGLKHISTTFTAATLLILL